MKAFGLLLLCCLAAGHQLRRAKRQAVATSLYTPNDPVLQLGARNFSGLVLNSDKGHMVEFYMSWCGHCRAFAPIWVRFARDVAAWSEIADVGAINCALQEHKDVCTENGVNFVPYIKYFPRNSRTFNDGISLMANHSVGELRSQLATAIQQDYAKAPSRDGPNFTPAKATLNMSELWLDVPGSTQFLALIVEDDRVKSPLGVELQLDLWSQRNWVATKRASGRHPIARALSIVDFPSLAVFNRRVTEGPVYLSELRQMFLGELNKLRPGNMADAHAVSSTPRNPFLQKDPITSRAPVQKVNHISETDLLMAIHYALFTEVASGEPVLSGESLSNLANFTQALAKYWPVTDKAKGSLNFLRYPFPRRLDRSDRARRVFAGLTTFLDHIGPGASLTSDAWQAQFKNLEAQFGEPFPKDASWVSCAGSSSSYRGYTCGLWSVFHALTVSTYLHEARGPGFNRFEVPFAIQGWVKSFFSCEECATHFMTMTNSTGFLPMNRCVEYPSDVVLYFWKAHNRVNARLAGDHTEDPAFPKIPWPSPEQCRTCGTPDEFAPESIQKSMGCAVEGDWVTKEVMKYLLRYYSDIKPHQ